MRTTPFSWVIMVGLLTILSIPPLIGFTFAATLTGFIYGVPFGFPIAITGKGNLAVHLQKVILAHSHILSLSPGAFMGSMICCNLIRRYNFARFIKLSSSKQDKYHAIQEAIEQGGLRVSG